MRRRHSFDKREKAYRRKLRRHQVTCNCSCYEFPHRLGGGRCYGREWAQSYLDTEGSCCRHCISNLGNECEVSNGQEEIKHCLGFRDHLHYQPQIRHPRYYNVDLIVEDELVDCPF